MNLHTSFKIGGPADIFVRPSTADELSKICELNIPITIIGDGTNILVSDAGIRGVVVSTINMCEIRKIDENRYFVQAGVKLSKLAEYAYNDGLTGLEFASGIPGTVGGAVYMNAGAFENEVGNFIESVTLFDGSISVKNREEMQFSYRHSVVQDSKACILDCVFSLKQGNKDEIRGKMNELNKIRREKQPLNQASAGSTFKRPNGKFAGVLIENCGLKGYKIGNAAVSDLHAGFIINIGNATAEDVMCLIKHVQNEVFSAYGVKLEPEVRFMGF